MIPEYRVELLNVSKSFGGIYALQDVTLKAKSGEIHALVGENGAGKSTLVKILSGAYEKNSGSIKIDGVEVKIKNPHDGRKSGIGIIYQEFSLVPELSVAENICLQSLYERNIFIKWSEINRRSKELITSMGFAINPQSKVRDLNIADQQVVEIAKALSENVKILILDEPTAVLAPQETSYLFEVLKKLKQKGVTIIYISHRIEEVFRIADVITVLRDGIVTGNCLVSEINKDDIIRLMIGRKLNVFYPSREINTGNEIFRVDNICLGDKVKNVSFSVREGEVLGISGLVGSGKTETVRSIFSADKGAKGTIHLHGIELKIKSTADAVHSGIGLVPEDRKTQGLILPISIKKNISLTDLNNLSGIFGFIKNNKEKAKTLRLIQKLAINAKSPEVCVSDLSGGNQQKVVLAKWLDINCKVLFMDEPTRGVDIGAKTEIYSIINGLAGRGLCIVIISSEIMELIGVCDRILVMKEGKVQGILEKDKFSEENILRMAVGT
jgi:ribose transport system ATP-binding protein